MCQEDWVWDEVNEEWHRAVPPDGPGPKIPPHLLYEEEPLREEDESLVRDGHDVITRGETE